MVLTKKDFARSHPGGTLVQRLLTYVRDVMRTGEQIPSVSTGASLIDALAEITRKNLGMTAIVDADNHVFRRVDRRRYSSPAGKRRGCAWSDCERSDVKNAVYTISADVLAVSAVELSSATTLTRFWWSMPTINSPAR